MERLGFFSEQLAESMARHAMTGKALATRLACSYEHVRKMVLGQVLPSLPLLQELCAVFRWSERRLRRFVMMDRARKQFGGSFWVVLGRKPECDPIYILWQYLTEEEKDYFIRCLGLLVTRKQTTQTGGGEATQA